MIELCNGMPSRLSLPQSNALIDHGRFRHSPGIVTKVRALNHPRAAHDIAEHFVSPIHLPRDRLRIGIDQQVSSC